MHSSTASVTLRWQATDKPHNRRDHEAGGDAREREGATAFKVSHCGFRWGEVGTFEQAMTTAAVDIADMRDAVFAIGHDEAPSVDGLACVWTGEPRSRGICSRPSKDRDNFSLHCAFMATPSRDGLGRG